MSKRKVLAFLLLITLIAAPGAWAKPKPVKSISLSPQTVTLPQGVSVDLEVEFKPASASSPVRFKSSNKKVAVVDEDGIVTAMGEGKATITCKTKNGKTAKCQVTVKDPDKVVALTFDDGPCKNTQEIVDLLKKYKATATFFMLGSMALQNPTYAKAVADAGFEVACHGSSHNSLQKMTQKEAKADIDQALADIESVTGVTPALIRPPYGAMDKELAAKLGYTFVNWSVDTLDWKSRDAKSVLAEVQKSIKPGVIILMHDLYASTTEAVSLVLPELIKEGYSFVTVSELLTKRGVTEREGILVF